MASLFSSIDPWIEDTFVHACEFDLDTPLDPDNGQHDNDDVQSRNYHEESQEIEENFQESQESQSTCYNDTQNTVPSDLRSQPTDFHVDGRPRGALPSRQAQLVQVIHRGGSGWIISGQNGNRNNAVDLDSQCPPYLIIHDGQYSALAFLSPETMSGLGFQNQGDSKSDYSGEKTSESSRIGINVETGPPRNPELPVPRSLIYVSNFTVATVRRCLMPDTCRDQMEDLSKKQRDLLSRKLRHFSPDIDKNGHSYLSVHVNQLLCLYIMGNVVKEGAENQGFIGNSDDVHRSVRLRRALIDHERWIEEKYSLSDDVIKSLEKDRKEEISHTALLAKVERCHRYYQMSLVKSAKPPSRRTAPDWPWKSILDENGFPLNDRLKVQHVPGNVEAFLGENGRSGDILDIIGKENSNRNEHDVGGGRLATTTTCKSNVSSSMPIQHGDVSQLFQNGEDLEEILGLSSESEAFVTPNESFTDNGESLFNTATAQTHRQNKRVEAFETLSESSISGADADGKEPSLPAASGATETKTATKASNAPACKNGGGNSTREGGGDLDDSSRTVDLDEDHMHEVITRRATPHKHDVEKDNLPSFVGINQMLVDDDEDSVNERLVEREDFRDDIAVEEVGQVESNATNYSLAVKMEDGDFDASPLARSNSADVEDDTLQRSVSGEGSYVFRPTNQPQLSSDKKYKEDTDPDEAIGGLSQIPLMTKRPPRQIGSQYDVYHSNSKKKILSRNVESQLPLPVDDSEEMSLRIGSPHQAEEETGPAYEAVCSDDLKSPRDKNREKECDGDGDDAVGLSQIPITYTRSSRQVPSHCANHNDNFEHKSVNQIVQSQLSVPAGKNLEILGDSNKEEGYSCMCSQSHVEIRPQRGSDSYEPSTSILPDSDTDVSQETETNKPCRLTSRVFDLKGSKFSERDFEEDYKSYSQSNGDQLFTQDDSTISRTLKHQVGCHQVDLSRDLDTDQPSGEVASSRNDANIADKSESELCDHGPERGENVGGKCTFRRDDGIVGTISKLRTRKRRLSEEFDLGMFLQKAKELCGL
ncbi:hypothetical protein ACHAXS_014495 [Conticribra weissflogii]